MDSRDSYYLASGSYDQEHATTGTAVVRVVAFVGLLLADELQRFVLARIHGIRPEPLEIYAFGAGPGRGA